MKSNFNDKLGMYHKVIGYIRLHPSETSGIPVIANGLQELEQVVTDILGTAGQASLDLTGFTEQKGRLKEDLVNLVSGISNVYMTVTAHNRANLVKFTKSFGVLGKLRDNELYIYAVQLAAACRPMIADFVPFGVNAEKLDRMVSLTQQFLTAKESPKIRVSVRKANNEKLPKLFMRADDILQSRIDVAMEQFRTSISTLYDGYWNARSIDQTGSRSAPDLEGDVAAGTIHEAAELAYNASREFRIKNSGHVTMYVSLSSDRTKMEGNVATVEPGQSITRKSSTLNDTPANFLLIENRDKNFPVSYSLIIEN